jgi:hypothetical protein
MSNKPATTVENEDEDLENNDQVTNEDLGQSNPLDMSDEDFLKQGAPAPQKAETSEKDETDDTDPEKGSATTDEGSGASQDPKAGGQTPAEAPTKDAKTGADAGKPAEGDDKAAGKDPKGEKDGKDPAKDPEKDKKPEVALDATAKAAAYDRLMAPFKANGREIQARSVEDAISLMQMGANYNKKMAGLKPVIKIAKLLENNGLLDEDKLSFLIDLHAKKPEAINKLVKDAGLNPMDLDLDKAGEYRPTKQTVDDREVELDTVLDDIKESSAYQRTLSIANGWDAASKKVIADHPGLLKVINDNVERGVYDLIVAEVERERTFGRLQGLSDIEAYRQVGDAIQARGGFDRLSAPDQGTQGKASEAGKVVEPKPKKVEDESRNDKRRALGTPRPAAPSGSTQGKDFNPLALSDEDFLKQAAPKFR